MNCPQHIPRKIDAAAVQAMRDQLERRIRELEAENQLLRGTPRAGEVKR